MSNKIDQASNFPNLPKEPAQDIPKTTELRPPSPLTENPSKPLQGRASISKPSIPLPQLPINDSPPSLPSMPSNERFKSRRNAVALSQDEEKKLKDMVDAFQKSAEGSPKVEENVNLELLSPFTRRRTATTVIFKTLEEQVKDHLQTLTPTNSQSVTPERKDPPPRPPRPSILPSPDKKS